MAHPGLVATCTAAFDAVLGERPNQLDRQRPDVAVTAEQLTDVAGVGGEITLTGVRINLASALEYLTAWLGGQGAVAINHLMEDAATVEISRMQLWQWIRHRVTTAEGLELDADTVASLLSIEADRLRRRQPQAATRVGQAARLLAEAVLTEDWPEFITVGAYRRHLVARR